MSTFALLCGKTSRSWWTDINMLIGRQKKVATCSCWTWKQSTLLMHKTPPHLHRRFQVTPSLPHTAALHSSLTSSSASTSDLFSPATSQKRKWQCYPPAAPANWQSQRQSEAGGTQLWYDDGGHAGKTMTAWRPSFKSTSCFIRNRSKYFKMKAASNHIKSYSYNIYWHWCFVNCYVK